MVATRLWLFVGRWYKMPPYPRRGCGGSASYFSSFSHFVLVVVPSCSDCLFSLSRFSYLHIAFFLYYLLRWLSLQLAPTQYSAQSGCNLHLFLAPFVCPILADQYFHIVFGISPSLFIMKSFQIISGAIFFSVLTAAGPLRRDAAGNL